MVDERTTNRKSNDLAPLRLGFHLMAKPVGPLCNLRCAYCFYCEKEVFFDGRQSLIMPDEVLEAYTRDYILCQPERSVVFDWQGGEPTLCGIDFFEKALALQRRHSRGKQIQNTLQTNGTLLDDAWCSFLAKHNFLVGLSIDGPADVHDACRVDREGNPTSARALHALEALRRHGVEVNVLATVNRESASHPEDVYRFFRQQGVQFIQFIPVVEREADNEAKSLGIALAGPPLVAGNEGPASLACWSVEPEQYGEFLIRVFDKWLKHDVGNVFVMNFEWILGAWAEAPPGVCYLAPRCGRNMILEHNGDIFSCDHYMYPAYRLGNILAEGLRKVVGAEKQFAFGAAKETTLPGVCRDCRFLFACHGGCPKHRFARSPDGEPGLNYLCAGLRRFLEHSEPSMKRMVELIRRRVPVRRIMEPH